ncbi:hypothetical protein [Nitrolancea hollandica]|nr:hypothetical protein [Nitrolancea hollandica]
MSYASTLAGAVRRLPFTCGLLLAMLVAAILTGALTHDLTRSTTLTHLGFGLPALERREFDTLLTSVVVALSPRMLAIIAFYVTLFVAPYEWVAGTRRAAVIFLVTQAGGYLLTSLAAWPLGALQFGWGTYLASTRDVGASAGAFGCAAALLWHLPTGWRRPATLALAGYLAVLLLFNHRIWDVEHAIAASLGYALGARLEERS